ncbi:MAG: hypothetical protein ACE360_12740 [Hyphomicrobiales bacterium]
MAKLPRTLWFLLALWLAAFIGSFIAFALIDPTGASFTRGMNRVGAFFGWQAAAIGLAVVLWWRARQLTLNKGLWWLVRVPIVLAALLVGAVLMFFGWAFLLAG